MSPEQLETFVRQLAEEIRDLFEPLRKEVGDLRAQLDEVKAAEAFRYRGVFIPNESYVRGNFVTHDGGLWHCNHPTKARPGESADWTLAVKKGRDAR